MNGVLLIDKTAGMTSHDVVRELRKLYAMKKIGHAGTLDPFATGLLILCLGKATKSLQYIVECDKEYEAMMKLGETTNTQDLTGTVLEQRTVPANARSELERLRSSFVGEISQIPPMFSARKVNGQRLYALARAGKTIERKARTVRIESLIIHDVSLPYVSFRIVCSKGTYVRTFAHDLGEALGCGAHLTRLRRTRIGRFQVHEAYSLAQLAEKQPGAERAQTLRPVDTVLQDFPALTLNKDAAARVRYGAELQYLSPHCTREIAAAGEEQVLRLYNPAGEFLALAKERLVVHEEGILRKIRPIKVFSH
ncbi:tRNA pseudouridine(55) synthase TruB [candidate division KSB3 bacterium]|uniref:tRNA pseudouridine synthase B n=1 Tax=candidate division KSB3 bacterium TaxID=2044937 RepID=A0A2G6E9Z8_9BACT|nr:MAG: tRNA pseudouridine(55) synthase TruB [candidate division KSB3 bacterium]PIE30848.1 MAG: tRNA pseudouridine(55) synthase TruB [candidate division KSB3 bacterium]